MPITLDNRTEFESLIWNFRNKYPDLGVLLIDKNNIMEERFLEVLTIMLTGVRIRKQSTYNSIMTVIHTVCDPSISTMHK